MIFLQVIFSDALLLGCRSIEYQSPHTAYDTTNGTLPLITIDY